MNKRGLKFISMVLGALMCIGLFSMSVLASEVDIESLDAGEESSSVVDSSSSSSASNSEEDASSSGAEETDSSSPSDTSDSSASGEEDGTEAVPEKPEESEESEAPEEPEAPAEAPMMAEIAPMALAAQNVNSLFGSGSMLDSYTITPLDSSGQPAPGAEINVNTVLRFNFGLDIPLSIVSQIQPGGQYTFRLPAAFRLAQGLTHIPLVDPNRPGSPPYAYYDVTSDGRVSITFTNEIQNVTGALTGGIEFTAGVNAVDGTPAGNVNTQLPGENFTNNPPITIKPIAGTSVSKAGNFEKETNPDQIIWTVDMNKDLRETISFLLDETLPSGTTFNGGPVLGDNVRLYQADVDLYGNIIESSLSEVPAPAPGGFPWSFTETIPGSGVYQLDCPSTDPADPHAYRLVMTTDIEDAAKPTTGGAMTFTNNVTYRPTTQVPTPPLPAQASVLGRFGNLLVKRNTGYDLASQTFSWQMDYNFGEENIPAVNARIDDSWPKADPFGDMVFQNGTVAVYPVTFNPVNGAPIVDTANPLTQGPLPDGDYTVTDASDGVDTRQVIQFNRDVTGAYRVVYRTQIPSTSVVEAGGQFVNTAEALPPGSSTPVVSHGTANVRQGMAVKSNTVDAGNQTITWRVAINENGYAIGSADNWTLTDTWQKLTAGGNDPGDPYGWVLRDQTAGADLVTGQGAPQDDYTIVEDTGAQQFTIQFTADFFARQNPAGSTNHTFLLTYNQATNGVQSRVQNTANVVWNGYDTTGTSIYYPTIYQQRNGAKSGSYNPVTKEITWSVYANYDLYGLTNARLEDPIQAGQAYVPSSVKIYHYTVNTQGGTPAAADELSQLEYEACVIHEPDAANGQTLSVAFPDAP